MADSLDRFMIGPAMAGELTFAEPYIHQPGNGLLHRGVQGGVPRGTFSVGYTEVIDGDRAQPDDRKAAGDPGGTYSARRPALPAPLLSRQWEHLHGQPLAARRAGTGMSSSGGPARYEIRIEGALGSRWAAWFDGLQVESEGTQTVIWGLLADQAALHGLLAKVRDLGLGLISVRRLDPDETGKRAQ